MTKFKYTVLAKDPSLGLTWWQVKDVDANNVIGTILGGNGYWSGTPATGWEDVKEWGRVEICRTGFNSRLMASMWLLGMDDAKSEWYTEANEG